MIQFSGFAMRLIYLQLCAVRVPCTLVSYSTVRRSNLPSLLPSSLTPSYLSLLRSSRTRTHISRPWPYSFTAAYPLSHHPSRLTNYSPPCQSLRHHPQPIKTRAFRHTAQDPPDSSLPHHQPPHHPRRELANVRAFFL
jgi:hypothetical protein